MSGDPIVVAGAGVTGLAAAWALARRGLRSLVVEPRAEAGGLAATRRRADYLYQPGIHLLHPSSDALRPLVGELCEMMGPDLVKVRPYASIYFLGRYLDFPFKPRQVAEALGPLRLARVTASALAARARETARKAAHIDVPDSFDHVVGAAYGKEFYRLFFRDYTAKLLGLPADEVAGSWARRRVPLPTRRSTLTTLFPWYRPKKIDSAHSPFHDWQGTGPTGMEPLFDALRAACGGLSELWLEREVARVELAGGGAKVTVRERSGREETLTTPLFVSTMPLTELVPKLAPAAPAGVAESAARLRYRGLTFVYLLVRGAPLFDAHWTYFQDPDLPFNRLSEFGLMVGHGAREGHTLVCAEMTADPGEWRWDLPDEELIARTTAALSKVAPGGSIAGRVDDAFVTRERFGYPSWRLGYEDELARVLAFLDAQPALLSVGRQGRFDYLNMDQCIGSALELVARAAPSLGGGADDRRAPGRVAER